MNIKTSKQLVDEAMKDIVTLDAEQTKKNLETNSDTLLIDIRDIRELKKLGTIENSTHIPRGMLEFWLDPESPYYKRELAPEKPKILFCASNWRSALAVKSLNEMGFKNVSHVAGGYEALLKSGFKIKNI
tara:strand:+ start:761 stop:1150 length:390 start_codon:yes stop_codon:yes gene_type:complete